LNLFLAANKKERDIIKWRNGIYHKNILIVSKKGHYT